MLKLYKLSKNGVKIVCSQDTGISRIGWGVSYAAKFFNLKHINFYPRSRKLSFFQLMSKILGGILVPIHGSYAQVMYYQAKRWLKENNITNYYYLPIGLCMPESMIENARVIYQLDNDLLRGSLVICTSSGTISCGLIYGLAFKKRRPDIYCIQTSPTKYMRQKLFSKLRLTVHLYGEPPNSIPNITLIKSPYPYSKPLRKVEVPFPCDIYLDRKAWVWLIENLDKLREPIVFWNIGGEWDRICGIKKELRGDGVTSLNKIHDYLKLGGLING